MKCQIQWIDSNGKPTPDTNDAVMIAHFHVPVHEYGTGKILSYKDDIQGSYPICAEHYAQVTYKLLLPIGGWSFTPIESR